MDFHVTYQLLEIRGVPPDEQRKVLNRSQDWRALCAEQERLRGKSHETLTRLRYAVLPE